MSSGQRFRLLMTSWWTTKNVFGGTMEAEKMRGWGRLKLLGDIYSWCRMKKWRLKGEIVTNEAAVVYGTCHTAESHVMMTFLKKKFSKFQCILLADRWPINFVVALLAVYILPEFTNYWFSSVPYTYWRYKYKRIRKIAFVVWLYN